METGNSNTIHRSLRKSNGNNFSLVSKQEEGFDIYYKFLHFAKPSLGEIGQNYGST